MMQTVYLTFGRNSYITNNQSNNATIIKICKIKMEILFQYLSENFNLI